MMIKKILFTMGLGIFLCLQVSEAQVNEKAESESSADSGSKGGEVSGFTFVVPAKDGGKQCIVRGDTANFLADGVIEIINVKTQVFRPGESDIFITSKKGRFNKVTREVNTDENVQIRSQEMIIQGRGLYWNPNENKAKIFNKVSVKIFSKPKGTL